MSENEGRVLVYASEFERDSNVVIRAINKYGGYRQVVKTQGCGSCIRGFESHYPPHKRWGIAKW